MTAERGERNLFYRYFTIIPANRDKQTRDDSESGSLLLRRHWPRKTDEVVILNRLVTQFVLAQHLGRLKIQA